MAQIADIEGIGEVYAKTLADKGINTTEALLETCATPTGRKKLADETQWETGPQMGKPRRFSPYQRDWQ